MYPKITKFARRKPLPEGWTGLYETMSGIYAIETEALTTIVALIEEQIELQDPSLKEDDTLIPTKGIFYTFEGLRPNTKIIDSYLEWKIRKSLPKYRVHSPNGRITLTKGDRERTPYGRKEG